VSIIVGQSSHAIVLKWRRSSIKSSPEAEQLVELEAVIPLVVVELRYVPQVRPTNAAVSTPSSFEYGLSPGSH